mgnify:CR=1 FL=1
MKEKDLKFYIQSSINIEAHDTIFVACEELGYDFESVPIIPFSTELTDDIDFSKPGMPYGSTTFIRLSGEHPNLKKYTYQSKEKLNPQTYYEKLGDLYLNEPVYVGPIKDVPDFEEVFMKCNSDGKDITGRVYTLDEIQELRRITTTQYEDGNIVSPDLEVFCSTTKDLAFETRNIFIGGEWIDGSYYRKNGRTCRNRMTDEDAEIIEFAKKCIDRYQPFDMNVVDIGLSYHGLKCIEYNCFNASGWYACDHKLIIQKAKEWCLSEGN